MAQYEIIGTAKEFCDFMKSLPFWKGGTNYKAALPYNCLYHATNDVLWGDCVCTTKSAIWGKLTIPEKGKNWHLPGKYGLEDLTCEQLIAACSDVNSDFTKLIPGECLWMNGHIGTYVGDFSFKFNGKEWFCNVIEATAGFEHGILATYVDANGNRYNGKGGEAGGKWLKHGRLSNWIDYSDAVPLKYNIKYSGNQTIIDIVEGKGTITITTNVK